MSKSNNNQRGGKNYNSAANNGKSSTNKSSSARSSSKGGNTYQSKMQGMQREIDKPPFEEKFTKYNSSKNQRREANIADAGAAMSKGNPIETYTGVFPQYVRDAATLPFALPLGSPIQIGSDNWAIPGVIRLRYAPAIGISENYNSPINRASIRFYTYMRSNQKASAKYDHQDITMMEVAMDACYSFHAMLRRIYGVINLFTPANEYYSRAILAACGVKFDDIRQNLQDFRAYINTFAYSLGQYALPANLEWFNRHRWMNEGIYVDGTSTKAQTYVWVPEYFYRYDNTVATGSQCVPETWLNPGNAVTQHTFAEIVALGTKLLNAVSNDADFAVISGDIYNFYGGNTMTLPYVDEKYAILPSYDRTVLSQIENLTIVGPIRENKITQDPSVNAGAIIFRPMADISSDRKLAVKSTIRPMMNMHMDKPTPDDIIEASRLIVTWKDIPESSEREITSCGTEICVGLDIFTRNPSTLAFRAVHLDDSMALFKYSGTGNATIAALISQLSQFDWAPNLHLYSQGATSSDVTYCGLTWDIDNFDFIPEEYIANIHLGCLLNEFSVAINRS